MHCWNFAHSLVGLASYWRYLEVVRVLYATSCPISSAVRKATRALLVEQLCSRTYGRARELFQHRGVAALAHICA